MNRPLIQTALGIANASSMLDNATKSASQILLDPASKAVAMEALADAKASIAALDTALNPPVN